MRMAVRKLQVEDLEKLQALVVENFDAIEPGLTVLDARLLLGHATIDVIGVDAAGALVLGAVGFTANEEMLLKAVEAYSWCLEYPEALVRLYPSCQLSEERPPRLLFVVERMPDAFHRKIKQLGFPEVDCVEFRHLEFEGVSTVYFESLLRLRRSAVARAAQPDAIAPVSAPENVIAMNGATGRAAGVKLPKLGQTGADATMSSPRAAERPAPSREPAAVVSMLSRQPAVPAPWADRARPAESVVLHEPDPLLLDPVVQAVVNPEIDTIAALPEAAPTSEPSLTLETVTPPAVAEATIRPVTVDAVPSMAPTQVPTAAPGPRVSFKDLADSLLGAMSATQEALAQTANTGTKPAAAEPLVLESAVPTPASQPVVAPVEPERVVETITQSQPAAREQIVAQAAKAAEPKTPAQTPQTAAAATSPAPAAPAAAAVESAKPAVPAMPQGFEGLKFPNDGVLTRQWMEFLSQMSTTK